MIMSKECQLSPGMRADDDKASVATAAGVRQAAPMVLNLEDPMQSTAEVLEMEMEALGLEQLKLLRDALYSSTNK